MFGELQPPVWWIKSKWIWKVITAVNVNWIKKWMANRRESLPMTIVRSLFSLAISLIPWFWCKLLLVSTQDCFKASWSSHKSVHLKAKLSSLATETPGEQNAASPSDGWLYCLRKGQARTPKIPYFDWTGYVGYGSLSSTFADVICTYLTTLFWISMVPLQLEKLELCIYSVMDYFLIWSYHVLHKTWNSPGQILVGPKISNSEW